MKPPHRYLALLPLIPLAGMFTLSGRWPALRSFIVQYGMLIVAASVLWSLFIVVLQLRYRSRKKSPASLSACHACDYELTGETHSGHCPECGATFRTP